jgi:fatty acid desaturase
MTSEHGTIQNPLVLADMQTSDLELSKYANLIKEFNQPNSLIFWSDFIFSTLVTNTCIVAAVKFQNFSIAQLACIFIGCLFMFRSFVFVHEAFHLRKRLPSFSIGYNILFGFLHKLPLYFYYPHRDHHSAKTYGTLGDPEYDTVSDKPAASLLLGFVTMALFPVFLTVRFGFVPALLPFIGKRGRDWVFRNASTLVMNLNYQRSEPTPQERRDWYLQDAGCFIYNSVFFALMAAQILPWKLFWVWFIVTWLTYTLNFYRVLVSHSYLSGFKPTSQKQQVLDSWTITGPAVLNEWWCPVGLRYHALHHMYPSIPYHNMGKAHRKLLKALPSDHPYRFGLKKSYFAGITQLIKNANERVRRQPLPELEPV